MIFNNESDMIEDEKLMRLVQPLSINALERLRQELLNDPSLRVVNVWGGYHLNNAEIYDICKKCELPAQIQEKEFNDINEAAIYICQEELKRDDLAAEYKKYLIGQEYLYALATKSDAKSGDSKNSVATPIAKRLFLSAGAVLKYGLYASAINSIFDQDIIFAKDILTGKIRISHENTIELSRLMPEEIRAIAKISAEERVEHITLPFIRSEVKWSHIRERRPVGRKERSERRERAKTTIRQMPEYDPDAEVNSLCMTIDSWISSVQRVNKSENFPKITHPASLKLMKKLSILEHTINVMQEALERTEF